MKIKLLVSIILLGAFVQLLPGQSYAAFPLGIAAKAQDLVADNNGNLHLVWVSTSPNNTIFYGRIVPNGSGGFTISGQQTVVAANGKATQWTRPRMAVRPDGSTVHVVYLESDTQVKHSWRNSSGVWTTEYIRNGTKNYAFPSIAVNANGTLHFIAQRWPGPIVYLRKPVGGTWSSDVGITDTSSEYRDCAMFTDPAGGVHATWHAAGKAGFYRYAPQGTDLSAVATLSIPKRSGVSTNCFGDLFVRSNGDVHTGFAGWGVELATTEHSYRPSGGDFQVPTCASNGTIDNDDRDCWPAVGADATRVYTAWAESYNGTVFSKVRLSTKLGTTWTIYDVDETAAVYSYSKPSMAVTSAGLFGVWRSNMFVAGQLALGVIAAPTTITVTAPNGGESWDTASAHNITWTTTGILTSVDIDYSTNGGGDWTPVAAGTANDGTYSWTVPDTPSSNCLVRVSDTDDSPADQSNAVFTIVRPTETVSTPTTPSGRSSGAVAVSYSFATGGSVSNLGHGVQYKFDWDDGSDSGWLATGTTSAAHSWAAVGTYDVRAMARCATHTEVESLWSATHAIVISEGGGGGYYNSPAQRLILPEVNWAAVSGGGSWISEVEVTDMSGGSVVQVYYDSGSNRRGPFTLWTNTGGANRSIRYANILQTIDGLDSGAFTYYGTSGSLELITQDGDHKIQASVRTYNGNYSRTFPALADVEENTAAVGREMIIPNISNNTTYRPSVVLFNPGTDSTSVAVKIIGSSGSQIGSTATRDLAAYQMSVITTEVRANTYSNANVIVSVTSGGRVMASGQTANNTSNDPAAHLAVQAAGSYANSPGQAKVLPEVNWAAVSGGGTWISEVQLVDMTGGSTVQVYYFNGTNQRGPFTLWTNTGGANTSVRYANILQTIDGLDSGTFTYYGTSGALVFATQDGGHEIHAAVRTTNGNYSRTFPALNDDEAHTAALDRSLFIPNISNNTTYRPSVVLFNPTESSVTVQGKIIGTNGSQVGSTFTRELAARQMSVVTTEVRANTYSNANIVIAVTAGSGSVIASGQTANNKTNDPAAHLAVQME